MARSPSSIVSRLAVSTSLLLPGAAGAQTTEPSQPAAITPATQDTAPDPWQNVTSVPRARPPEHGVNRRRVGHRQQDGSVVAAMLDVLFVALSVLFFVASVAYVAACRRGE